MEPSAVAREGAQLLTTTYNDQVWLLWSLLDVLINIREERERKQSRLALTGARGLLTCFYWLGTCSPPVSPGTEYYQVPQWTLVDSSTTTTTTACTDITRQTTSIIRLFPGCCLISSQSHRYFMIISIINSIKMMLRQQSQTLPTLWWFITTSTMQTSASHS